MKTLYLFLLSLTLLVACNKVNDQAVVLERNCTGTYLQFNDKNYKVCNTDKTAPYEDGQTLTASFRKISDCPSDSGFICQMAFPYESWIEVKSIR